MPSLALPLPTPPLPTDAAAELAAAARGAKAHHTACQSLAGFGAAVVEVLAAKGEPGCVGRGGLAGGWAGAKPAGCACAR